MEPLSCQLYIDNYSTLNLNADFFHSINFNFENSHVLKIELGANKLCKLLKNRMKCGLVVNHKEPCIGIIKDIRKTDGTYFLTCEFDQAVPALIK
jgi:hypothetical protein